MYAAARGRALHIPDTIPEPASSAAGTANVIPPTPISPPPKSQAARSQLSQVKAPSQKTHSVVSEKQRSVMSDATPRQASVDGEEPLNAEENRIVQEAIAAITPRSSIYSHSTLGPEATNPYHDMELCMLLHHLDTEAPEVVKKALKKAVKQRVKRLGLKNDNEVHQPFTTASSILILSCSL